MLYDRQADFEADARLGQTIAFYGVAGTGQIWLRNDLVSFVIAHSVSSSFTRANTAWKLSRCFDHHFACQIGRCENTNLRRSEVRYLQSPEQYNRVALIQHQQHHPSSTRISTAKETSTTAAMQMVFQTSDLV